MRPQERATARRQIDMRLKPLMDVTAATTTPQRGWVRAIREALGMTTAQLGRRLGVTQPRIVAIEKAEARGSITLQTLARTAEALDCRLFYAIVPRQPLETVVEERAFRLANDRLRSTRHTMALEAQDMEQAEEIAQLERLARQLMERPGSALWEEI